MVIDSEDDNAIAQEEKSQEISLLNSSIPLLLKLFHSLIHRRGMEKYTNTLIFATIFHDEKKQTNKLCPISIKRGLSVLLRTADKSPARTEGQPC